MARARAAAPGSDTPKVKKNYDWSALFRGRHLVYFVLFLLWTIFDIVELGLVSQQIHQHGQTASNWPSAEYQHAMGLLLFSTIIGLLWGLFHWFVSLSLYLPINIAFAVWWGTGAGIIEATPFGHGLQCKNPTSSFPLNWQPFVGECTRVTTIEGFAWIMFALSVVGLFVAFVDKYSITSRRDHVYDIEALPAPAVEKSAEH